MKANAGGPGSIPGQGTRCHNLKKKKKKCQVLQLRLSLMDSVGEGEGGKIWENGIETCIISCMKRVASPDVMHDTGCFGAGALGWPEG